MNIHHVPKGKPWVFQTSLYVYPSTVGSRISYLFMILLQPYHNPTVLSFTKKHMMVLIVILSNPIILIPSLYL